MDLFQAGRLSDYKIQNMAFIRNAIQNKIDEGIKKFAILPMGFWGKETKKLLEKEFSIKPQACFDNALLNEPNIHPTDAIRTMNLSNTALLIVVEREDWRTSLYQQAVAFVPDALIELVPLCNAEQKRIFEESEKVHLDFLCTGFHKCGTTSLQAALETNEHVFLPHIKETYFAMAITENSHTKLKQSYPDVTDDCAGICLKGGIEPTYYAHAASVRRYFGPDLKILFLVREPVGALRSAFKMSMRNIDGAGFGLIQKYKTICRELIKEYIEISYRRFVYIDFIRMYERYYPESQIKIVIAEELMTDTLSQMEAIQAFIGLPEKLRIKYDKFPHENKGNDIAFTNLGGAYVNHALNTLRMEVRDVQLYGQIEEIRKKVLAITTADYDLDQYEDIWRSVHTCYMDSITELEKKIGKSLKGIWY